MPAITRYGSTKRFGVRYGKKLKDKIGKLEEDRRLNNKCPYCHKPKIIRIAAGIWECTKCRAKFAGKAYAIGEKKIKVEAVLEEPSAPVEEEEAPVEEMTEEETKKEEEAA
jgi:large subunit ribosomal protein L37Ae